MCYKSNSKMLFMFFLTIGVTVPRATAQHGQVKSHLGISVNEETHMQYSAQWKKEIILWSKECIFEMTNKIMQMDQLIWQLNSDVRYHIGVAMGRIFEIYRQQIQMYRRMKRRIENKFTWIRESIANKVINPDGSSYVDYKPHVYMVALEYVTKRQIDIENIVNVLMTYTLEAEVGMYKPNAMPFREDINEMWTKFTTRKPNIKVQSQGRQGPDFEDIMAEKEKELKLKMRHEYYKKRNHNKNKQT